MGFDSTANLLFKIGADSSDAEGNIRRFRMVLSKDLNAMSGEFSDWSEKIFGKVTDLRTGMIGVTAALAGGVVGAVAAINVAAEKWMNYALEIGKASKLTGISTENMSRLAEAAEITGVPLDALTRSLGILYSNIVKANEGSKEQIATFRTMGISAKELAEAEKDPYSFLLRLSDAYHENASAVQKAALGRAEFGRGVADLLPLLSRGSAAIREMGASVDGTSKIVTSQAVIAAKEYKESLRVMREEWEKIVFVIGKTAIPILAEVSASLLGLAGAMKTAVTSPLAAWSGGMVQFYDNWVAGTVKATLEMRRMVTAGTDDIKKFVPTQIKEAVKTTKEEFYGLSSIVQTIRGQMAGLEGDEARIFAQAEGFRFAMQKAEEEFFQRLPKLDLASFEREFSDLRAIPGLIGEWTDRELGALAEKRKQAAISAAEELEGRLVGLREQSFENQRAAAEREIALLIGKYQRIKQYTETNAKLIEQIRAGMLGNIDREQAAAFQNLLGQLKQDYDRYATARMTPYERLRFAYDEDVRRFSGAEEQKALALATSIEQMLFIINRFGQLRKMALDQYGKDLMVLHNSQGWQGVFGGVFARNIRQNEELLREWAESADRLTMVVRVTLAGLVGTLAQFFDMWAQAMGANIAAAIVWRKSIGDAMRQATAESLQAIAAKAYVEAIWCTAWGFISLAQWNFSAAAEYFTAAGILASVGTAAALAGRAVAPKQGGAGAAGGAGEGVSGGGTAAGASEAQETRGPRVQIIINGHVIGRQGIDEIAEMINDAVRDRDVPLLASGVKNNTRLLR